MAKKKILIPDNIDDLVFEYQELKKKEKQISERKKVLADIIKSYATQRGVKDSNGSYYSENENYVFGTQCRKSISFNLAKSVKFFEDKGYEDCIDLKPSINNEAVEQHLSAGDITPDEIEAITDVKTVMAIDVREKDEVVSVQQATASIAAQKKKPVLRKKK